MRDALSTSLAPIHPGLPPYGLGHEPAFTPITLAGACGEAPVETTGIPEIWTWGNQSNAYDLNGNFQDSLLPPQSFGINGGSTPMGFDLQNPIPEPHYIEHFQSADFGQLHLQQAPPAFVMPEQAVPPFQPVAAANSDLPRMPQVQANTGDRLRCPLGCAATFGRPGDYRRHMRKHERPRYRCAVIDCDMQFARFDKLRDHLRQGHRLSLS